MKKEPSSEKRETKKLDWGDIHRRLETAREFMKRGFASSPGEKKRILKERAMVLAREPEEVKADEAPLQCLEFILGRESYAVESADVREVCPPNDLTPLPCAPPFVLGIINLRGQIISVVDLKKFFGLPGKGLPERGRVIVIRSGRMEFGVLADTITGMRSIPRDDIQPPPALTSIDSEYLKGIAGDGLVLLDAENLLSDERLIVHEEA